VADEVVGQGPRLWMGSDADLAGCAELVFVERLGPPDSPA